MTSEENEFIVIGAGLPRTGTFTLKTVLGDLLGKPCYHMAEVGKNAHHVEFWAAALKGKQHTKEEWRELLKDYGAGVDAPICFFFKELMDVYPNAKVLLSVRDPEKWYDSVVNTTAKITKLLMTRRGRLLMTIMGMRRFPDFGNDVHKAFCGDNWEEGNKEDYIYRYRKHIEEVKRIVPEDKLLIYDVKEGYAPLCQFLGVPVREGSLPRLNDRKHYDKFVWYHNAMAWAALIGTLGLAAACVWGVISFIR